MELNGCYRAKVNSKASAIPIVTASALYNLAVRIGIANVLKFIFVL